MVLNDGGGDAVVGNTKVSLTVEVSATTSDFDYLVCFRPVICHQTRYHLSWVTSGAKTALVNAGVSRALLKPPVNQLKLSVQQWKSFFPLQGHNKQITSCFLFQSNGCDGPTMVAGVRRDSSQHEGMSNATSEKTSFSNPTNGMKYKKA